MDTDGDGKPDDEDRDSDGDGIPDEVEAGDLSSRDGEPRDSDGDGTPDYRDLDSDGNGIPDAEESRADTDDDGLADYADRDDDDDRVRDRRELALVDGDRYADFDGDGAPNFKDPDSDDDTIEDGYERDIDTDRDGVPDWKDLDSDGDGFSDRQERGDREVSEPPVDTDDDGRPDFRDLDSDDDGLSDEREAELGTDRADSDTDGDGVADLIELTAGTDPLNPEDHPREQGDFVFVVPYQQPPTPARDTLRFRTDIQFADVYFLFDKSGSMDDEMAALRGSVRELMGNLTCANSGETCSGDGDCAGDRICSPFDRTCIEDPASSPCVPSVWTGFGLYERRLDHRVSMQPDPGVTADAIPTSGSGGRENLFQSVRCLADRAYCPREVQCSEPRLGRTGCPNFRERAVKILVTFTDEDSDGGSLTGAAEALLQRHMRFLGVWSGNVSSSSRDALVNLAIRSESLDDSGEPLVYDGRSDAVVPEVTSAINDVVKRVPLRVTVEASDEPGDAGDATQFIDHLQVDTQGEGCSPVALTEDRNRDGHADTFPEVAPGTSVCWQVVPARNGAVRPTDEPQVFRASVTVHGDGSPLDTRQVYFLVPPVIEPPAGPR